MPYKPGLGQGHNQKKDTHTLDFDVILSLGLKQLTSLIFHFAKICLGFPFGQQPGKKMDNQKTYFREKTVLASG